MGVAFYTFDEKDTFKNNIADENFMTQQQTYLTSIWTQNWYRVYRYWWGYTRYLHIGTTTNRSFQTLLLRSGECQIESFRGNMAWHVSGNKMGGAHKRCSIRTKDIITFAKNWDQCRFALRIRDVDHEYQSKEQDDKICFQVMDHKKRAVLQNKVCQKNDITEGYGATKTIKTKFFVVPDTGINVRMTAKTNSIKEHWYSDNLAITCKKSWRVVKDGHDATVNGNKFDAAFNSNNLYTKHDNLDYNENDHTYNGQRVAHFHNGN